MPLASMRDRSQARPSQGQTDKVWRFWRPIFSSDTWADTQNPKCDMSLSSEQVRCPSLQVPAPPWLLGNPLLAIVIPTRGLPAKLSVKTQTFARVLPTPSTVCEMALSLDF